MDEAYTGLSFDLVLELAEALAEHMLSDYEDEDWRVRPTIETLARVAAMLEANGRDIPPPLLEVLRRAAETGRLGLA